MGTGGTLPSSTPTDLTESVQHISALLSSIFTAIQLFESLATTAGLRFATDAVFQDSQSCLAIEGRAFKTE